MTGCGRRLVRGDLAVPVDSILEEEAVGEDGDDEDEVDADARRTDRTEREAWRSMLAVVTVVDVFMANTIAQRQGCRV